MASPAANLSFVINTQCKKLKCVFQTFITIVLSLIFAQTVLAQATPAVTETLSYADEMAFYKDALGISGSLSEHFDKAFFAWNARALVEAEKIFNEIDQNLSDKLVNVKAYLYLNRGLLKVDQNDYEAALSFYREAKKLVPSWWLIDAHIAEVHALQAGNNDEIIRVELEPYHASIEISTNLILYLLAGLSLVLLSLYRKQISIFASLILLLTALALFLPGFGLTIPIPFSQQDLPNQAEASKLLDQILSNTYRAFIFREEEVIYDALALSVTGEALREIYLQNRNSVKIQAAADATMRIDNIEIAEIKDLKAGSNGGFQAHASWQVSGFVRHFGHLHYRLNAYEAIIELIPEEGTWKIKSISVIQQTQLI